MKPIRCTLFGHDWVRKDCEGNDYCMECSVCGEEKMRSELDQFAITEVTFGDADHPAWTFEIDEPGTWHSETIQLTHESGKQYAMHPNGDIEEIQE